THTLTHTHTYKHTHTHIHIQTHTLTHTHTHTNTHRVTHTHINTHIHTYKHTHTHTHKHTHTHIHIQTPSYGTKHTVVRNKQQKNIKHICIFTLRFTSLKEVQYSKKTKKLKLFIQTPLANSQILGIHRHPHTVYAHTQHIL